MELLLHLGIHDRLQLGVAVDAQERHVVLLVDVQHGALVRVLPATRPAPLPGEDHGDDLAAVVLQRELDALGVGPDDVGRDVARGQVLGEELLPVDELRRVGVLLLDAIEELHDPRRLLLAHLSQLEAVAEAPEGDSGFLLDVHRHLGQSDDGLHLGDQTFDLRVLEGASLVVELLGAAEEHEPEGGTRRRRHRGGVGLEQRPALLDHPAVVRMPLGQLLHVRLGALLLLLGELGDRQATHEAPEVHLRLRLEVGQGLLGRERDLEVRHEPVEELVVEGLALGVVLAGRLEPHPLERDRDPVHRGHRLLVGTGRSHASRHEEPESEGHDDRADHCQGLATHCLSPLPLCMSVFRIYDWTRSPGR